MWLGVAGGTEIILGALVNLVPSLPTLISSGLILLGLLTVGGSIAIYRRDLRVWKTATNNPDVRFSTHGPEVAIFDRRPSVPGEAMIDFSVGGTMINNSRNVVAVADHGVGDYEIMFAAAFPDDGYSIIPLGDTRRDFEVTEITPDRVRIRYPAPEPSRVALKFGDSK